MTVVTLVLLYVASSCSPFAVGGIGQEDHFDLQAEIDHSSAGDTIWVPPGTYYGNFDYHGRSVVVKSEEGPENTVLDGRWQGSVVSFQSGEDTTSVLEGFTVTHGSGTYKGYYYGGGILCWASSAKIVGNIIIDNHAFDTQNWDCDKGGGIYGRYAEYLIIKDNIIKKNYSKLGGGMYIWGSSCEISGNSFEKNWCETWGMAGGGSGGGMTVFSTTPQNVRIMNNLFIYNTARPLDYWSKGGGLNLGCSGDVEVSGNMFVGNRAGSGGGLMLDGAQTRILGNIFAGNVATGTDLAENDFSGQGGGIRQHWTSGPDLVWGNTFYGNSAREVTYGGDPKGGGVYSDGLMDISNNLIVQNEWNGIYIYEDHEPYVIRNNDLWRNTHGDYGGSAYPGEGDISANPQLDDAAPYWYELKETSPCIDAGIDLGYDFCGEAPEMGAWEYCPNRIDDHDFLPFFLLEMMDAFTDSTR